MNTDFNDIVKRVLKRLFTVDNTYRFNTEFSEVLIRGKRVADTNYFNRYFNLQLSHFDIQEDVFDRFINKNSLEKNEQTLKEINENGQLFQFLNWIEIKSKGSEESKFEHIINSILNYSKNLTYKSGMFWGKGTDLIIVLHYGSNMLKSINDLKAKRNLILKHIGQNKNFASLYLCDRIQSAYELLEKGKLYSNNDWYYLFKFEKEIDKDFSNKIFSERNSIAKDLFNQLLFNSEFLNEDEIGIVLEVTHNNFKEYYEENFPKLITKDKELVKYLWLSIKRSWMTSGSRVGYQLAEYQFFPGLNKEDIKIRLGNFNLADFDENEKKIIALFEKAYSDGFVNKKYYDIETLDEMGR